MITNKKANYYYNLEKDRYEAGLVLSGAEAKSIREGRADIGLAVCRIVRGEMWLINANIPVSQLTNYSSTRTRKLLMHKDEIIKIGTKIKQRKLTIIPLKLYTRGRFIKAQLALGKAKRKFEKKEAIKRRDIQREIAKELKNS